MTFFTKRNTQVLNNFLHFNGFYWSEVVSAFRNHGVILSGGTTTKRHILSPNQLRLSQLLSCQEGSKLGENIKSFYLKDTPSVLALTPKENTATKSIIKRDTLTVHEYDIEPFSFNPKDYNKNTVILEIDKTRFNLDQTKDQSTSLALLIRTQDLERQRVYNFTKFGIKKSNEELKALFNELKNNPNFSGNISESDPLVHDVKEITQVTTNKDKIEVQEQDQEQDQEANNLKQLNSENITTSDEQKDENNQINYYENSPDTKKKTD
jgi:hypothetical protein